MICTFYFNKNSLPEKLLYYFSNKINTLIFMDKDSFNLYIQLQQK